MGPFGGTRAAVDVDSALSVPLGLPVGSGYSSGAGAKTHPTFIPLGFSQEEMRPWVQYSSCMGLDPGFFPGTLEDPLEVHKM